MREPPVLRPVILRFLLPMFFNDAVSIRAANDACTLASKLVPPPPVENGLLSCDVANPMPPRTVVAHKLTDTGIVYPRESAGHSRITMHAVPCVSRRGP